MVDEVLIVEKAYGYTNAGRPSRFGCAAAGADMSTCCERGVSYGIMSQSAAMKLGLYWCRLHADSVDESSATSVPQYTTAADHASAGFHSILQSAIPSLSAFSANYCVSLVNQLSLTQIASSWNGFAYICDGEGTIGNKNAHRKNAMVLGKGDVVTAKVSKGGYMRFLLICG